MLFAHDVMIHSLLSISQNLSTASESFIKEEMRAREREGKPYNISWKQNPIKCSEGNHFPVNGI